MTESTCGFQPFTRGGYKDWVCTLPKRHRGRHRYINYTITKVPHLHSGMWVVARAWARHQRRVLKHLIKYKKRPKVDLKPMYRLHWESFIWPTKYEPVSPRKADYDA